MLDLLAGRVGDEDLGNEQAIISSLFLSLACSTIVWIFDLDSG